MTDSRATGEATDGAIPPEPTPEKRPFARRFGLATAIVLPLITASAIVIPMLADGNTTRTSGESLKVEGRSTAEHGEQEAPMQIGTFKSAYREETEDFWTAWSLSVDAPIEDFPYWGDADPALEENASCTAEQTAWLDKHAVRVPDVMGTHEYRIEVMNTSDTGGALSLENIRFEGNPEPITPRISFACYSPIGAGVGQMAFVEMDGSPAIYGENLLSGEEGAPPGTAVTLNVQPGGTELLNLYRPAGAPIDRDYTGRILASMISPSEEEVVLGEEVTFLAPQIGGYSLFYEPYSSTRGGYSKGFWCTSPSLGERVNCTREEAALLLKEAANAAQVQLQ